MVRNHGVTRRRRIMIEVSVILALSRSRLPAVSLTQRRNPQKGSGIWTSSLPHSIDCSPALTARTTSRPTQPIRPAPTSSTRTTNSQRNHPTNNQDPLQPRGIHIPVYFPYPSSYPFLHFAPSYPKHCVLSLCHMAPIKQTTHSLPAQAKKQLRRSTL
jgi:hypothetical protein